MNQLVYNEEIKSHDLHTIDIKYMAFFRKKKKKMGKSKRNKAK